MRLGSPEAPTPRTGSISRVKGRGGGRELKVGVGVGRERAREHRASALTPALPAALHPRRDGPGATG